MDASNNFDSSNYPNISGLQNEQEDSSTALGLTEQSKGPYREQDIYLPIANIARIMKTAVPSSGKIAKDAKECVQECVSEFISFITSEASERCAQEKRKTINGEDVLFAMSNLGFDPYIPPLKVYLQKYRDTLKAEKGGAYFENPESTGTGNTLPETDLVDPFAPSQFHEILGTAAENTGVFSNQTTSIDQQLSNLDESLRHELLRAAINQETS